jgi:hypothetical protein
VPPPAATLGADNLIAEVWALQFRQDSSTPRSAQYVSRKAETIAGLAIQVRAFTMVTCGLEDMDDDALDFAEAVRAFVGLASFKRRSSANHITA